MSSLYSEESCSSEETDASTVRRMSPNTRKNYRRNVTWIVCLSSAITLLVLNFLGAVLFYFIENRENYEDVVDNSHDACLSKLAPGAKLSLEAVRNLKICLKSQTKIDTIGKSLYFSWTLYSTVGYGNMYPQTVIGRFSSIVFSLIMIPIYISFKFEFGTILANFLLKIAEKLWRVFTYRATTKLSSRDNVFFLVSLFFCVLSLLVSSTIFSLSENISFLASVYFGVITMALIGIGDIVPTNLTWFLIYTLFFLVSDVLSNHIFYFCQARIRLAFHFLARRALLLKSNEELAENTISLNHVPVINTQCMPSHAMECEKKEIDKDEKLLTFIVESQD